MDCEHLPISVRQIATPLLFVVEDGDKSFRGNYTQSFQQRPQSAFRGQQRQRPSDGQSQDHSTVVGSVGDDLTLM